MMQPVKRSAENIQVTMLGHMRMPVNAAPEEYSYWCTLYTFVIIVLCFFQIPAFAEGILNNMESKMPLDRGWQLRRISKPDTLAAEVPGCVHTDLLKAGRIPDPFYRLNEHELQWIDKEDWEYTCRFLLDDACFQYRNIDLVFEGLDTYADIYVNNTKVLYADNMFRTWTMSVRNLLKPGTNLLTVYFHSPINTDLPKLEKLGYGLPADNDLSEIGGTGKKKLSIFARKAPYHYGWDWGPRFVTSGIWRPVFLRFWNSVRIESVKLVTQNLTKQQAALLANIEAIADRQTDAVLAISVNDKTVKKINVNLKPGINLLPAAFEIDDPEYWWPRGMGKPNLYSIKCAISCESGYSEKSFQYGLRDIRVVQKPDSAGRSFYFEVNNLPVFMKGANYIPGDIFLPRMKNSDYENIIHSAFDANMNTLRVWGGGIYENDIFYDLCDKYGILVWQDCMFACSMYPGDKSFLESVREEITDNVKRLRNHASIAIWAGNNEIEDAWNYWGWQNRYNATQRKEISKAYSEIFLNIIPDVIRRYDGTRFYWPSSPGSDFGKPSKPESGDFHYWEVWHGKKPFEEYHTKKARFFSEYGFQSFPDFTTVKKYSVNEDWDIESDVMKSHQRSGIGNLRIRDYINMYYHEPKDFKSFLYVSQVLQAFGIKQAIEAHRLARPYTMGSLYWQIDDCWPVASWSSMDYYKRWKALHYTAKRSFAQVTCIPSLKDDLVTITVSNDNAVTIPAEMRIAVMDFEGKIIHQEVFTVTAVPLGNTPAFSSSMKTLLSHNDPGSSLMHITLLQDGTALTENILYFRNPKDLKLKPAKIDIDIETINSGYILSLSSSSLAKDVCVDIDAECSLSDNYFDLLPGKMKKLNVKTSISRDEIEKRLNVHSLVDSYRH